MKFARNILIILVLIWFFWWTLATKSESWYWMATMCSVLVTGVYILIRLNDD